MSTADFDTVRRGIAEPHRANNRAEYADARAALDRIEAEQLRGESDQPITVRLLDEEGNELFAPMVCHADPGDTINIYLGKWAWPETARAVLIREEP